MSAAALMASAAYAQSDAPAGYAGQSDRGPAIDERAYVALAEGNQLETEPPPGFGAVDSAVETFFDLYYLDRNVGAFRAVLDDGRIRFLEPEAIADALAEQVDRGVVLALLAQPLDANERFRCFGGQTTNCGVLPPGTRGVIVNPERFSAELFFLPADVLLESAASLTLGPPSTGPSLIQTVNFSASRSGGLDSGVRFGATFDTAASIGATAFLARTVVDDEEGARLLEAAAQHVWGNRIARAGLFEDFNTRLLTSFRVAGAEFASFYPRKAYETGIATPIQIVLPREADVELRRQGVIVSIRHYSAGPQLIDTSSLPEGSYPIEIVARSGGTIVFEDVRSFTKAPGLPIAGETEFSIRAGFYAPDMILLDALETSEPFFPRVSSSPVIAARMRRRISGTTAFDLNALHIDGNNYAEASLSTVQGALRGFATVAGSDNGSYGALVSGSLDLDPVRISLTGRYSQSEADDFDLADLERRDDYRPFTRSERSVFGSVQFPLAGGSMSASAGYTRFSRAMDDYSIDLRYTRPIRIAGRRPLLSAYARASSREKRIGFTLNFLFGLDRRTSLSVRGGGEYLTDVRGNAREGLSPVVDATLSHLREFGNLEILGQVGVATQADADRAFASADMLSSLGQLDLTAQHQRQRGGDSFNSIFANGRTGFAIGGGGAKFGLAEVGEAIILSDIAVDEGAGKDEALANSGYRIKVNGQPFDRIVPGSTSAVGVPAYEDYRIELTAENAPPYEIDTRIQAITLYPGNVAYLRYEAAKSYPVFGRLVDTEGRPLAHAILRTRADVVTTDERGYFLISVHAGERLGVSFDDGSSCRPLDLGRAIDGGGSRKLYRAGDVACERADAAPAKVDLQAGQTSEDE